MNINDFISPFYVLSADNFQTANATNANVDIILPQSFLFSLSGGYSDAPTGGFLQLFSGATKIFEVPLTQDGPFPPQMFKPAPAAVNGGNLTARLTAGGAGVVGYLNVASSALSNSPPALIQQVADTEDTLNILTATLANDVGVGNSVIVWLTHTPDLAIVQVVLGASGAMTRVAISYGPGGQRIECWYLHKVTGGAGDKTIVITGNEVPPPGYPIVCNVSEWSGLADKPPVASAHNGDGTGSTVVTTNPVAPLAAESVCIGVGAWVDDLYDSGPTNGFTRMDHDGVAGSIFQETAYKINSVAGSYSTGWALSASAPWNGMLVAFQGE